MNGGGDRSVEGVLVVDKPAGMTSHDVIDEVRRKLATKKVGHAGTLDPDATGVLVLGVGRATRLLSFTQATPKRYRAGVRFGITTSTQDASGEVLEERVPSFTEQDLRSVLTKFAGEIDQVPPMVSAVKVGGERLYKKARRGEDIERPSRRITIYEIELVDLNAAKAEADLEVVCSGGTYVRTLAHDIGGALGCGAHLTSLRRTVSGGFTESDAVGLEAVDRSMLRPMGDAVRHLRRVEVDETAARAVRHGRALPLTSADSIDVEEGAAVAVFFSESLLGVYTRRGDELVAERVLAA